MMGVTRKLLGLLMAECEEPGADWIEQEWEKVWEEIGISLWWEEPEGGSKKKSLAQRVEKSSLSRPDFVKVLDGRRNFFDVLQKGAGNIDTMNQVTAMREVWERAVDLIALAELDWVEITEDEWMRRAKEFGRLYVDTFGAEEVTSYIHILVYHVGFFLDRYGTIERFANYSTECTVGKNRTIHTRTRRRIFPIKQDRIIYCSKLWSAPSAKNSMS
jgi:hypothetical protein